MSTLPPKGQGPFQRGERLTAAKLNELAAPKAIRVFGQGHVEGDTITVDQRESMYIRLTNKTGSAPIKYAWKEVYRESNGTWVNMTHTGNVTNDFAVEINNSNLSTSDNYVYRAERSLTTGEWLFFFEAQCEHDTRHPRVEHHGSVRGTSGPDLSRMAVQYDASDYRLDGRSGVFAYHA